MNLDDHICPSRTQIVHTADAWDLTHTSVHLADDATSIWFGASLCLRVEDVSAEAFAARLEQVAYELRVTAAEQRGETIGEAA